ncbi:unnamed protein product [Microthlaspi erraticum]|uniref:RNase H type-1 domain-containing protein n=1 Tax=Microthlaspi erraticum TaxID=1685480 RepID=A0A6D2HLV6_9BRAS|nr:unnamed protein product [Microthlaspi erraticum]CAA7035474.1 unnamed protein product [Microthlaspi erraticum]
MEVAKRAYERVMEWIAATSSVQVQTNSFFIDRGTTWEPPPQGWLKCNFDSSFHSDSEHSGLGWIVRWDHKGAYIDSDFAHIEGIHSSLQAEASAFLQALQMVWVKGWRNVWFEGDCLPLVNIVNMKKENIELASLLEDVRYWMSKLPNCSLGFINRERNSAADKIAKYAY